MSPVSSEGADAGSETYEIRRCPYLLRLSLLLPLSVPLSSISPPFSDGNPTGYFGGLLPGVAADDDVRLEVEIEVG